MDGWRSKGKQVCRHLDVRRQIYLLIDSKVFFFIEKKYARSEFSLLKCIWQHIIFSYPLWWCLENYLWHQLGLRIELNISKTESIFPVLHTFRVCFIVSPHQSISSSVCDTMVSNSFLHYAHTERGMLPTPWPGPTMVWKKSGWIVRDSGFIFFTTSSHLFYFVCT